jgi:hypothetical protein
MVSAAKWDRKLVTDLSPERPVLREAQVVSIGWYPAANQTRLLRYKSDVTSIPDPTWFWQGKRALIDRPATCLLA